MTFRLAIVPAAERDLARLDPPVARRIRAELLSLAGEADPRRHVRRLKGRRSPPFYALRVGDYRVILQILNDRLMIVVVEVGHRSIVYQDI
jgi:mRNA interferase RelE/StbE